jgi:hypothetical protein
VTNIDRREFVKKAGLGAAGAGALWVAPSVLGIDAAFAGASCLQQDSIIWSSFGGNGTAMPTSIPYAAVGSYPALTVTLAVTTSGTITASGDNKTIQSNVPDGGGAFPGDGGFNTGSVLMLHMRAGSANQGQDLTFSFSVPVYNLKFTLVNIDFGAGSWQDRLWIDGAAFTAQLSPTTEITGGPGTSQATEWIGSAGSGTTNSGNVAVTMAGPVTSFTIHYRTGTPNGGTQHVSVNNVTWCR